MLSDSTVAELTNGGVFAAAVLAVLLIAFSTYGRRFCRHPAVRVFVWGASMVFLPLSSAVLSALKSRSTDVPTTGGNNIYDRKMWTILLWIVLILAINGNANIAAVAATAAASSPTDGDVSVDGNRIRPPVEILAQYAWLIYLIKFCVPVAKDWLRPLNIAIFIAFSLLGSVKLILKLAAFYLASGSFALGKNARLIAGYMDQLQAVSDSDARQEQVPRYIVMGENNKHVEESPQGYRIKQDALQNKFSRLITLDRVWRLAEHGDGILAERVQLRDLCLSYSLFKILRRRLSGYPLADAGSSETLSFVLRGLDSVGTGGADRVFRILKHELRFASDSYYSPIPLCIFSGWCAALNYLCSLLMIFGAVVVGMIYEKKHVIPTSYKLITYVLLLILASAPARNAPNG